MIIDFHTHTFPEKIAAKAIEKLSHTSHSKAFTDGTEEGLLAHMKASGVTHSVILPVATSARQVVSINDASARLNERWGGEGLISFAAMHPDFENPREELARIRQMGFRGIKIHPVYQGANIDSPAFLRILERCAELGLLVVTHAGLDIGFPGVVHVSPAMCLRALREIGCSPSRSAGESGRGLVYTIGESGGSLIHTTGESGGSLMHSTGESGGSPSCTFGKTAGSSSYSFHVPAGSDGFALVLAHMGGWKNWDEVAVLARELCETGPVMVDTAFATGHFPPLSDGYWKPEDTRMLGPHAFSGLVRAFGAGRVLFGSDLPWSPQAEVLSFIENTDLTEDEKRAILWENASRLLGSRVG